MATARQLQTATTRESRRPARLRILVIDDNVDVAETLAEVLRQAGHNVFVAHDGRTGLACFDSLEPDLAIVDLGMPLMDGYQMARFVRADARFKATPLIAHSCLDSDLDRERTRSAGFDHHVSKFDVEMLEQLLASYLK